MKKENIVCIHRIYGVLLSISIVLAGISLIAGCLTIYFTGERVYSREIVANTFSNIAIPIYVCLVFTIVGFVLELLLPSEAKKSKTSKAYGQMLHRLTEKKDFSQCDEALLSSINKERKSRKLHTTTRTLLLCITSILFLVYALNGNNFHQSEINASMIQAMWILLPCLAIPFGYAVFTVYRNEKSMQREIELLKQVPMAQADKDVVNTAIHSSAKVQNILRYMLLFIGAALLIYGFVSGGTADVLTKAINICTECIGLG